MRCARVGNLLIGTKDMQNCAGALVRVVLTFGKEIRSAALARLSECSF